MPDHHNSDRRDGRHDRGREERTSWYFQAMNTNSQQPSNVYLQTTNSECSSVLEPGERVRIFTSSTIVERLEAVYEQVAPRPRGDRLQAPPNPAKRQLAANNRKIVMAMIGSGEIAASNLSRPIRVLMVCARYLPELGGIETHVYEVSRRLGRMADFDVTVLTTDITRRLPPQEVIDGTTVLRVPAWPRGRDYYFAPKIASVVGDRDRWGSCTLPRHP